MANVKVLNKDPFTYAEERRRFLEDLRRFHTTRGTLFDRIPQISGREVDLYRLYQTVIDLGGWQKVNNEFLWEDIQEDFNVPGACTNGAQALKYIYFRYLNIYEKVHFLGLDPDNCNDEPDEGPARKKICLPVESIPLTYNYNQHKVPDHQRDSGNLSGDLAQFSDYDKLEMALRSGLPNEVDFAVNVCLLLSNEGRYVLKLHKSLHLLTLLLANVGIFEEGLGTMEDVMIHSWRNSESKRDFLRFWHDTVKDEKIRENIKTRVGVYKRDEMVGSEVLHLGRDLGVRDAEGQRVLQLAMLIRNLSFEDFNQPLMASHPLVFRFLMLCVHSSYGSLRQLALDTLGNLAAQMVLRPVEALATQQMITLVKQSLADQDKFVVVRGLEMLSRLCNMEKNEVVISEHLDRESYERLVRLLTVADIQLIVHTLETLYQLSELGHTPNNMIAGVRMAVDLLVNLITVEAQSFGPDSLMGIKVVEYVPPVDPSTVNPSALPPPSRTVMQAMAPGYAPGFPVPPSPHLSAAEQAKSDVETTAANWLLGTYEIKKGSSTKQADLFAQYQQFCCKFGIADTLTAADLVSIVKSTLPQAKVAEVDKDGQKETVLKVLSKRAKPKPFAILAGSDKVCKPSPYSMPIHPWRGPGPANWQLNSVSPVAPPAPNYTPTLRQRLMEPPQSPSLPQALVHYAGATGAGAPPSARGKGQQSGTPKAGGKKRAMPPPAQPSGPGPGPGSPLSKEPAPAHPSPLAPQQLQVAGVPQAASSFLQPCGGDQILMHSSSAVHKPGALLPAALVPTTNPTFTATTLTVSSPVGMVSSPSPSPGQQFPTIHQALQGETAVGAGRGSVTGADQGTETGFIKSLLAKKVCQNLVRQANTPCQSPPPSQEAPVPASVSMEQSLVLQPHSAQLGVEMQQARSQLPARQVGLSGGHAGHNHQTLVNQTQATFQAQAVSSLSAQHHTSVSVIPSSVLSQQQHPVVPSSVAQQPQNYLSQNNQVALLSQLPTGPQQGAVPSTGEWNVPQPVQSLMGQSHIAHSQSPTIQGLPVQSSQHAVRGHQGQQLIGHPHVGHIQQRMTGQQATMHLIRTQGGPPHQVPIRPGQQQVVMQPQQIPRMMQGQPVRIHQTPPTQPLATQTPVYQQPQVTTCASASLPTTLVQSVQATTTSYRAIDPHQSPSVGATFSSHRAPAPATVSALMQAPGTAMSGVQHAQSNFTNDCGNSIVDSRAMTVQSGAASSCSQPNVCNSPSLSANSDIRSVSSKLIPPIPAIPACQTQWTAAFPPCKGPLHPSSSTTVSHPAPAPAFSSSLSSSSSSHSALSCTTAVSAGQEVHTTGSSPLHPVRVCAESLPHPHPHPAMDNTHTNGSSGVSVSTKKDCNGLVGVVNGGLGSPDSASNELPPSPMEGVKSHEHIPNGLLQGNGSGWKDGAPLSKQLLYNMAEKMGKINGVAHHLENGDPKIDMGQSMGKEEMEGDCSKNQPLHVNGLGSPGASSSSIQASQALMAQQGRTGQALVKQTSMEEASLDSTDSRLVINCGKAGGETGAGGVVRPLFSPNSSHDSDVSCDSFASSLADSVSSDKHSTGQAPSTFFPRPSSTAPSPSPSPSCSMGYPEVPLVLAGTVPKSEAVNKKKKKAPPKPKAEKPPPKSKKKKGGKNAEPESAAPPAPAEPLVMEYMCEWAGCGRCFDNARLVYLHASKTHVPAVPESVCQWQGCEPLRRKRWSLVTHLQDHHCSEMAQRAACQRRFQAAQTATASPAPQTVTPLQQAPALVYPVDAALQAIRRFHIKPPFVEFTDQREGPVTKHIRLTAALILRNLARFSIQGRSLIKQRERQLSYVTMSTCESSTALSSCLWEILHHT